MTIILDDNNMHLEFAPLSFTRPIGNIRCGILTNDERWKLLSDSNEIVYNTEDYLSKKFPTHTDGTTVNACVIPNENVARQVMELSTDEELQFNGVWIARNGKGEKVIEYEGEEPIILTKRWHLFQRNGEAINLDYELLCSSKTTVQLSPTNTIIGNPNLIFLESGASVEAAILNTTNGPIYIGKDAEVMEGSIIRGPFAMSNNAVVKMGAKIYGPTSLGPYCKVGGELNNVQFQGYSNKGHDGFLGNSLIGEWCNLGADTNTSNLKNNYGTVKTYSYVSNSMEQTTQQFMGLVMGDHSKCGINTMFNTASVVGVSSNIFGPNFPPKHVASFTWGMGTDSLVFSKAIESANNMLNRRELKLSEEDIAILRHISDKK